MKTKFCLLLSLILIVIVAITSYTPQAAQAEVQTQKDPVTETEEIPFPDAGKVLQDRMPRIKSMGGNGSILTPLGLILSLMIPL